ncbi:MAG TPA: low molecular weight protein-tyrosine-phosphatase [Porticoccaceae bacterium]|nr:low molecular weight protein-tyrosine-phosphatase [Porticoccaceae bacterium]
MNREADIGVLFVCLGNICRSPTAEGVFAARVAAAGLAPRFRIDSAGTGDWHLGKPPDPRTRRAARERGYDLEALRARQVRPADFHRFDYILAMDGANLRDLERLRPAGFPGRLDLFLRAAGPLAEPEVLEELEVPDPYGGDASHFEQVLDLIEQGAERLLAALRTRHGI